ncbi:MAG TPA: helicase-related protein, partial [Methanomassiliicoccales archaeon]|nr:helicase-related protein [Methanomassiliicoccales archaeon]
LIKKDSVESRDYQTNLARTASQTSTLLVLPTGMGKTVIALLVIADVLQKRKGKVLFLAPTKPLVEQHACSLAEKLEGKKVGVMTGEVPSEERALVFRENDVIASTPQVVANDIKRENYSLKEVSLIVFDEAHRAVGDYAYVTIGQEYKGFNGLVLGMTASPGSSGTKIREVCANLGIEKIDVRSESDPDVAKYMHEIQMDWVEVDVPQEMKRVILLLKSMHDSYLKELVRLGVMDQKRPPNTKYVLEIGQNLQRRYRSGERHKNLFSAMSVHAMALKIGHALELAETQGVTALRLFMEKLQNEATSKEGTKAARTIALSPEFIKAFDLVQRMKFEHPKLSKVMTTVSRQVNEKPESRIMVFTHYRDTCDLVASKLAGIPGARVTKLVGQADHVGEKGLKQKEQVGVLQKFRDGEFNVLVATSVGEEGLDVASTDLVVFYEPVASEIRSIQRRGRTGRMRSGRVVVLVTRGTRDEAYLYAAINKERAMKKGIASIQRHMRVEEAVQEREQKVKEEKKGQTQLFDF